MQVKDELRVLVEAEVARAVENFKKFEKSVGDSEEKTLSLGDAIDSISKKAMFISAAIGGAGIAAVKFAGENEKLKLSLENMLGSADEASAVFEEWRRLGTSPGLSIDEVVEAGRAMVNMGHDTAYATKTIQTLGDIAAGTGRSFGAISGVFEHVRAAGKLTTRDLVNLQQQGIPVLKQLSKEMGVSEESVRRLADEGKIGFSDLERAFRSMAGPGGQFAGMMDAMSDTTLEKFNTAMDDAKQALASFGELMLPMATELLDGASSILRGLSDMDEGTKRFVVGMGGVIALAGPLSNAAKGIAGAVKTIGAVAAAAGPAGLAIAGVVAALGAGAFVIQKQVSAQANEVARNYNESVKQMTKNNQDLLRSADSFENVSRKIRGLSREMYNAAKDTGNFSAANEAALRLTALSQRLNYVTEQAEQAAGTIRIQTKALISALEAPVDPNATNWFLGYATELEKINDALAMLNMSGYGNLYKILIEQTPDWAGAVASQNSDEMLRVLRNIDGRSPEAKAEIERIQKEINELASGATIQPFGNVTLPDVVEARKRWQDWYSEITKTDAALYGDASPGAKAAELYLADFSRTMEAGKTVFAALGEEFDLAGALRSRQADIQKALVDLFSIDPNDIDEPFEIINHSIQPLIIEYKRLGEAAREAGEAQKAAAGEAAARNDIDKLRQKIDDFGKSEGQLAYNLAITNRALPEQAAEIRRLTDEFSRKEIIADYQRQLESVKFTQEELAEAALRAAGATGEEIDAFRALCAEIDSINTRKAELEQTKAEAERLKETIKGIKDSFINLGAAAALGGIEEIGRALGQGAKAGEAMQSALAAMSLEILNALPNMFLQAGLQLISQGQWALGLGFVAASGLVGLSKGYVNGKIEEAQKAATANAHGNIYGEEGIRAFARGGTFTNQIVQNPTLFKFAQGTGLMGEAGPEAIMPLTRMPNGDLGVKAAGNGGAQVQVNIYNKAGAEISQEERTGADGSRQIDIIIGGIVDKHLASGKADRVLGSRFGITPRGV